MIYKQKRPNMTLKVTNQDNQNLKTEKENTKQGLGF